MRGASLGASMSASSALTLATLATASHPHALPLLRVPVRHDGRVAGAVERPPRRPDFPVNRGQMCIKGFTSARAARPSRARHDAAAARRATAGSRRPSWEAALDFVAERLLGLRDAHGADALAAFGSGALTNEKAYLLGKFARVALGTPNIDYNGRYCMSSAAAGQNRAFGIDRGLPFPVSDIAETQDADAVGLELRRHDAADHAVVRRAARPRRRADRRRPARAPTPRAPPTCTCSSRPAPTSRWPTACCTSRSKRGLIDRDVHRARAPTASTSVRRSVLTSAPGPRRAADRRADRAAAARGRACWRRPRAACC